MLIAEGSVPDLGATWQLWTSGTRERCSSRVRVLDRSGVTILGGGMAGPTLYSGDLLNVYVGRNDETGPTVVLARLDRSVARLVLETEPAASREVPLYDGPADLDVSLALVFVDRGERLLRVRAFDAGGHVVESYDLSGYDDWPPHRSGYGWSPDDRS